MANIVRELRIDDLSRLSGRPKDFLDFKTSFCIHLDCEEFKMESLFASSIHSCFCVHIQDFCLNSENCL